jgi:hypothetical protein
MAFADIKKRWDRKYPNKTSERFKRLDAYDRLRQGTFYDVLPTPFDMEYDNGQYIPIRQRRPSIVWGGAQMLASQIAGLLFGDEQMPVIRTYLGEKPAEQDRVAEKTIQHLSETLNLDSVMDNVTDSASSGSCAVIVRATSEREPYIEVIPGKECLPKFDPTNPKRMVEFEQLYPTTGNALVESGYDIPEENLHDDFWFRLTIDSREEVRYRPMLSSRYERLGQRDEDHGVIAWVRDEENSRDHGWGQIPVLWIKAPSRGVNKIDGDCLYGAIVDILVSIDYDLSQIERGFRYTADPMLAIRRGELAQGSIQVTYDDNKTQHDSAGQIVKSPANILDVDPGGEAKLLEISGQGLDKFREFAKTMREWGLEIAGGMKADADSTKGTDSGRALEILYQNMILLLKRWRVSLGNMGYIPLLRLLLEGINDDVIVVDGVEKINPQTTMRLVWQAWMTPTGQDLLSTANAWQVLAGGSAKEPVPILPRSTISRMAAGNLGMTDTSSIIEELETQNRADDAASKADAEHAAKLDATTRVKVAKVKPNPPKTVTQ